MAWIGCTCINRFLAPDYSQRPRLPLLAPQFSVVAMLLFVIFGNVYTGQVGTIVCRQRLGMHNQVSGEWPLPFLPQLEIVRPGATVGQALSLHSGFCVSMGWGSQHYNPMNAHPDPPTYIEVWTFCRGRCSMFSEFSQKRWVLASQMTIPDLSFPSFKMNQQVGIRAENLIDL